MVESPDIPQNSTARKSEDLHYLHCIHVGNSIVQADVFLVEQGGTRLLLKDFSPRPLWIRLCFARFALKREARVMETLQGVEGIPRFLGMPSADQLLMEYIEGPGTLSEVSDFSGLPISGPAFFVSLKQTVRQMQARGVSHGDIRKKNILLRADGRPCLIDFATGIIQTEQSGFLRRFLHRIQSRVDRLKVLKLQQGLCPESVTDEERQLLLNQPWYFRVGQWLRKRVYRRFIKQRRWKERLAQFKSKFSHSVDSE